MALATLRNSIFFKGLDEQALQTIHAAAQPSYFKKGAFVFQEGEIATAFYVLPPRTQTPQRATGAFGCQNIVRLCLYQYLNNAWLITASCTNIL
jgi:hypothetical protein